MSQQFHPIWKKWTCNYSKTYTWPITATVFTITKKCKQPTGPSTGEQFSKMCLIHKVEYYSAIKRNKVSCTLPHRWTHFAKWKKPDKRGHILYDSIYVNRIVKATQTENGWVAARGWGEQEMGRNCSVGTGSHWGMMMFWNQIEVTIVQHCKMNFTF